MHSDRKNRKMAQNKGQELACDLSSHCIFFDEIMEKYEKIVKGEKTDLHSLIYTPKLS
jgi:hypothetical protein